MPFAFKSKFNFTFPNNCLLHLCLGHTGIKAVEVVCSRFYTGTFPDFYNLGIRFTCLSNGVRRFCKIKQYFSESQFGIISITQRCLKRALTFYNCLSGIKASKCRRVDFCAYISILYPSGLSTQCPGSPIIGNTCFETWIPVLPMCSGVVVGMACYRAAIIHRKSLNDFPGGLVGALGVLRHIQRTCACRPVMCVRRVLISSYKKNLPVHFINPDIGKILIETEIVGYQKVSSCFVGIVGILPTR